MSLAAQVTVGDTLSESYRLERVVAEGGMGVVFEAQHLRLPRRVAVKVLGSPKDPHLASTALQRFRREAEIAASLSHPHIVEVFDYRAEPGAQPYLVMELLDGEDLSERLRRVRRLGVSMVLRIVDEVAAALEVAHGRGVVHRDLKPANIFLARIGGRNDFVKVLDFGVSKLVDSATLTHERAMVGTPLYMSPEQAVGQAELGPRSDLFSLGSIAYEMLSGRRAFAAQSVPSILYQIVHGAATPLAGVRPGLGEEVDLVFARALAKRPEDRYAHVSDFAAALRRACEGAAGTVSDGEEARGERESTAVGDDTEVEARTGAETPAPTREAFGWVRAVVASLILTGVVSLVIVALSRGTESVPAKPVVAPVVPPIVPATEKSAVAPTLTVPAALADPAAAPTVAAPMAKAATKPARKGVKHKPPATAKPSLKPAEPTPAHSAAPVQDL